MPELLAAISQRDKASNSYIGNKKTENYNSILKEIFTNTKTKNKINYSLNGIASLLNLITFIAGNFNLLEKGQEKLNSISETLAKFAFSCVSIIGAVDFWQKKNLFPFIGYVLAVPLTLLSSGYDFWLTMGVSSGFANFIVITDQREVVDKNGNPIKNKNGQVKVLNGDFSERGWLNGIQLTYNETFKMLKELIEKPSNIKKVSHAALISSLVEILGGSLGLFNMKAIGATLRNTATICAESSMLLHKDIKNNSSNNNTNNFINFKSPVAQSGILWIGTSLIDLLKRFDSITNKVNNLTHLSLFFDRLASIRFTQAILNIKKDH